LLRAAEKYSIPVEDWLDLSTGINPNGWPVPAVPAECWQRLPEQEDGLIEVAANYYDCESLLAVSGSQAAIQILPKLRSPCRVAVPEIGYAEHRFAWEQNGHHVIPLSTKRIFEQFDEFDVIVIINPNNPTGEMIDKDRLIDLHKKLARKEGWLIVDEAFMDMTPDQSLTKSSPLQGLLVLRSVGKFFGLAGIRAGFVVTDQKMLNEIENQLGPWSVTTATRWITKKALADHQWQDAMRQQLRERSARLNELLETKFEVRCSGTDLFQTCWIDQAADLYERLAQQGILVRLLDQKEGLRLGLPSEVDAFDRLEKALSYSL